MKMNDQNDYIAAGLKCVRHEGRNWYPMIEVAKMLRCSNPSRMAKQLKEKKEELRISCTDAKGRKVKLIHLSEDNLRELIELKDPLNKHQILDALNKATGEVQEGSIPTPAGSADAAISYKPQTKPPSRSKQKKKIINAISISKKDFADVMEISLTTVYNRVKDKKLKEMPGNNPNIEVRAYDEYYEELLEKLERRKNDFEEKAEIRYREFVKANLQRFFKCLHNK
jgi:hypothetical protein